MNSLQLFGLAILFLLGAWYSSAQLDSIGGLCLCLFAAVLCGGRALIVNHHEHTN